MKPRGKKYYDELGNQIYNKMISKYKNIKEFTDAGSRKRGDFKRKSDLDMRFCMSGDPLRESFYPKLEEHLNENLSEFNGEKLRYKIGDEGHVLNVFPANGGKATLVLLSESEYDRQESK